MRWACLLFLAGCSAAHSAPVADDVEPVEVGATFGTTEKTLTLESAEYQDDGLRLVVTVRHFEGMADTLRHVAPEGPLTVKVEADGLVGAWKVEGKE